MSEYNKDRDDFWDIQKLVPRKRPEARPFVTERKSVLHTVEGESQRDDNSRMLTWSDIPVREASAEVKSYEPEERGLIKRVTVIPSLDRFDFYGGFRKSALLYHGYSTPVCDFVPFYSYMPQYSQLTLPQKNYYFYWRSELLRGRYLKSDYSYIYLFVYEILNLPDKIPPKAGLELLVSLWREYRGALPRLDASLSAWVQDYCLVHRLAAPTERVRDFLSEAIAAAPLKEFYLSGASPADPRGTDALLAYLSDYDWRRGRYAGGEYAETYRRHMLGSMGELLDFMLRRGYIGTSGKTETLSRSAFPSSLCTHAVKCRLEIEYTSLSADAELRREITAAVRYAENKLRALIGIKSRLAVKGLSPRFSELLDGYFDSLIRKERARRERESLPEYEKLYDAPREALSFSGADEIERMSWQTTLRLVEDTDLAPEPLPKESAAGTDLAIPDTDLKPPTTDTALIGENGEKSHPCVKNEAAIEGENAARYGLSDADVSLIREALFGGAISDFAAMERINEAFSDGFGDVILEPDGDAYIIIEDYKEELSEWISKITG
ncbi:MAG: TerB N-terminal domain-containing protein [Clostridia bacterium]|nr:TerB N-terminal domain-containing protein [Clostridia bacterium]